jgi:hypothetical protein
MSMEVQASDGAGRARRLEPRFRPPTRLSYQVILCGMKFAMTNMSRRCRVGEIRQIPVLYRGAMMLCLAVAAACGGDDAAAPGNGGNGDGGATGNSDVDPRCVKSTCTADMTYYTKDYCQTFFENGFCITEFQTQLECIRSHSMCDSFGLIIASSIDACTALGQATIDCLLAKGGKDAGSGG